MIKGLLIFLSLMSISLQVNALSISDAGSLEKKNSNQVSYKPGLPLSMSEKDNIIQQIVKNWSILPRIKDYKDVIFSLKIKLAQSGEVTNVDVINKIRYKSDKFYGASVDLAIRAIYKASPFKNLPIEKYDVLGGWRELELNFDPSKYN